jgi:hypothetical protein
LTSLPIGSTFAGYRIERLIDRGGMGVVYLADDRRLRRKIALKLIASERAADPAYRHRFLLESELLGELEHPNIVTIHAAGEWHGQLYLAMRYVDGMSLARLLATRGPLDLRTTFELIQQVGDALDAAHARGIVHRDVKPANVLVSRHGRVYLGDFGLTRRTTSESDLTSTGVIVGTVGYMAPERFTGEAVDRSLANRVDVYALGCLLHACLTAREPFPRDSREATLWAHVHAPPPSPRAIRPELPVAIDEVVEVALAKDPADRYPTAGSLVDAVRRIVAADPARAVPESPPLPIVAPVLAPPPARGPVRMPAALPAPPRPGAATGRSRPARSGRRPVDAALTLAAGLGVLGALLFAVGLIGHDGPLDGASGRALPGASAAPRPTDRGTGIEVAIASPAPVSVASRLLARIPIRDDCTQALPQQPSVTAEFRCTYPRQDIQVAYDAYEGEATKNQAWAAALAADRFHAGSGRCPARAGEAAFYLSNDPLRQEAGRLVCFVAADRSAVIRWTLRDHGIIATAVRRDGDLPALYQLWATGTLNTTQERR